MQRRPTNFRHCFGGSSLHSTAPYDLSDSLLIQLPAFTFTSVPLYFTTWSGASTAAMPLPCLSFTTTTLKVRCFSMPGNSPLRAPMVRVFVESSHANGIVA